MSGLTPGVVRERVRVFLDENFYIAPSGLRDTTALVDEGIIDSTGVLTLVHFLEGEFGLVVDDAELLPENLGTVANVAAFVLRKKHLS